MSNETYTTTDCFKVEDVTHRPKRRQGDFIETPVNTQETTPEVTEEVRGTVTIESAIKYFSSHAKDNPKLSALYSQTAMWLSRLRTIDMRTLQQAQNEVKVTPTIEEELDSE